MRQPKIVDSTCYSRQLLLTVSKIVTIALAIHIDYQLHPLLWQFMAGSELPEPRAEAFMRKSHQTNRLGVFGKVATYHAQQTYTQNQQTFAKFTNTFFGTAKPMEHKHIFTIRVYFSIFFGGGATVTDASGYRDAKGRPARIRHNLGVRSASWWIHLQLLGFMLGLWWKKTGWYYPAVSYQLTTHTHTHHTHTHHTHTPHTHTHTHTPHTHHTPHTTHHTPHTTHHTPHTTHHTPHTTHNTQHTTHTHTH